MYPDRRLKVMMKSTLSQNKTNTYTPSQFTVVSLRKKLSSLLSLSVFIELKYVEGLYNGRLL